jgi:protease YdgD
MNSLMRMLHFITCAFLTLLAWDAFSREPVSVNINDYPWSAVGKLYNRVGGACTAALVSHTELITAAHCLYNHHSGEIVRPTSLHFLLRYNQGEYSRDLHISKFVTGANRTSDAEMSDWAVLTLDYPTPESVKPLSLSGDPLIVGSAIMVGGFSQLRPFVLTADSDCSIRTTLPSGLLVHDCAVMNGDSGAPLIRVSGDRIEVLGIHVGSEVIGGTAMPIAVPVSSFIGSIVRPAS